MDPVNLDALVAHPVIRASLFLLVSRSLLREELTHRFAAQGHGKPGYTSGQDLPAVRSDSRGASPATSRPSSRPGSRSHSPFRHDSFFHRGSNTPGSQEREQREATMRQVGTAQDATYEADLERAMRRSKRDEEDRRRRAGEAPSQERSDSHARGLSRIRAAIKERECFLSFFACSCRSVRLANLDPGPALSLTPICSQSRSRQRPVLAPRDQDRSRAPGSSAALFFPSALAAQVAENCPGTLPSQQDEYMKRVIIDEVNHARASTDAGAHDRERAAARSRSRIRSPLASRNASRDRKDHSHLHAHAHANGNGNGNGAAELAPPVPDLPSVPQSDIPSSESAKAATEVENGVTRKDLNHNAQVGELTLG